MFSPSRKGAATTYGQDPAACGNALPFQPLFGRIASKAKANRLIDVAIRRNPLFHRRIGEILYRLRDRPLAEIEGLRAKLTERTLRRARRTRYGRGRSSYDTWPILTTDRVAAAPGDFLNSLALFRAPASSGEITGTSFPLLRSLESIVAEQFFLDELLAPHGFTMHRSRIAILRGDRVKDASDMEPPFGWLSHGGRRLSLSTLHLGPQTVSWFYRALREFRPQILWVYPNAVASFLKLIGDERARLGIPVILAASEIMSPDLHLALERHFDGDVVYYYGQPERVCFGYSTRPHRFYFHPGYGRVELILASSSDSDVHRYRVVGTSFWNAAMPLVRYDTGDTILVPAGYDEAALDEVKLGRRHFLGIEVRDSDYLVARDGARIAGLNQIPRQLKNVFQMQLVQDSIDSVKVNVVAGVGFGPQDLRQVERAARTKVPEDMSVRVAAVEQLETNRSGKAPFVLCRINQDARPNF